MENSIVRDLHLITYLLDLFGFQNPAASAGIWLFVFHVTKKMPCEWYESFPNYLESCGNETRGFAGLLLSVKASFVYILRQFVKNRNLGK